MRKGAGRKAFSTLALLAAAAILACDRGDYPRPSDVVPTPPKGTGTRSLTVMVVRSELDPRPIPGAVVILETPAGGTLGTTTFGDPPTARFLQVDPPYGITAISIVDVGEEILEAAFTVAGVRPASDSLVLPLTVESNFPPLPGMRVPEPKATLSGTVTGLTPGSTLAFAAIHERGIVLNSIEDPALAPVPDPADSTRALLPAIELPEGRMLVAALEPAVDAIGGLLTFTSFAARAITLAPGSTDASLALAPAPAPPIPLVFSASPEPVLGAGLDTVRVEYLPEGSPGSLRLLVETLAPGESRLFRLPPPGTLAQGGGRYRVSAERSELAPAVFATTTSTSLPLDANQMASSITNLVRLSFLAPPSIPSPAPAEVLPAGAVSPLRVRVDDLGQSYPMQIVTIAFDDASTSIPFDQRWQVLGPAGDEVVFPDLSDPDLPATTPAFFFPGLPYFLVATLQDLGGGATFDDIASGLPQSLFAVPVTGSASATQSFTVASKGGS